MHTLKSAGRGTPFFSVVLPIKVFHRVLFKGYTRIAALLGTPVYETFLTDVEITGACTATPVVSLAFSYTVLKPIEACVIFIAELLNLLKDVLFFSGEWFQSSIAIMNDSDGG